MIIFRYMENSESKKQIWKNKDGLEIASVEINENGMIIKIELNTLGAHRKEMEELLTLGLYPPKEEEKAKGEISSDGKWITYETKKGQKWELAKVDMVNTFHFWFGE